jgi:hypothetical protein
VAGGIKFTGTGNALTFPDGTTQTTAATVIPATNGLTKIGNSIGLGGTLTQATTIVQAGNTFGLASSGAGTSMPDQQQPNTNGSLGSTDVWQSFTAGVSGQLTRLDFYGSSPTSANGARGTLSIYAGEGTGGTLLTTQAITFTAVFGTFQAFSLATPVAVVAGQQYTYRIQTPTSSTGFIYVSTNNPYAGGQYSNDSAWDLGFKTYVLVPAPVFTALPSGNVGIGTASPGQRLEVAGTVFSSSGGFRFPDNTVQTTAAVTTPATTASNGLAKTGNNIALGGTLTQATTIAQAGNAFGLTGTGNVGIGTASPSQKLEVAGLVYSSSGGFLFPDNTLQSTAAVTTPLVRASNGLTGLITPDGSRYLLTLGGALTQATTIAQAGNAFSLTGGSVGIGTSNPAATLDVTGNTNVMGNSYVSGYMGIGTPTTNSRLSLSPSTAEAKLTLFDGGGSTAHYGLGVSGGQLNYHVLTTADRHVFYATGKNGDGTELMRIQGNGNVGIGAAPVANARLQVSGTALVGGAVPSTANATGIGFNSMYVGSNESEF